MKKERRAARELALNILYQNDAAGIPFEEALQTAMEFVNFSDKDGFSPELAQSAKDYAAMLAEGVHKNSKELDLIIQRFAEGWPPERQSAVDRNIIRLALYEMKYVEYIPESVAVDEAVELAKKYSTEDSGRFVNGILGAYYRSNHKKVEKEKNACKDS
ncbi:MAG: transcription antitermination factor NusB [Armatimonadota bacterium]